MKEEEDDDDDEDEDEDIESAHCIIAAAAVGITKRTLGANVLAAFSATPRNEDDDNDDDEDDDDDDDDAAAAKRNTLPMVGCALTMKTARVKWRRQMGSHQQSDVPMRYAFPTFLLANKVKYATYTRPQNVLLCGGKMNDAG
jgi:hypothetical protein